MMNETKICTKCSQAKPISMFSRRSTASDGFHPWCNDCKKAEGKKYYNKNRDKVLARQKANYKNIAHKKSEYQKRNRVKINTTIKARIAKNPEYYRAKRRQTDKRRYANPKVRARRNLSCRALLVLRGAGKSAPMLKLLGCSLDFFISYITEKFLPGMTWDNYGMHGWHYDHIIPCASFNLDLEEEQRRCFHYTNYQPLWAKDNLRKSDNIGPEWGNG